MREIKWLKESRIIISRAESELTIEDVRASNEEIKAMLDKGQAPVHLVFHTVNLQRTPTNIREISGSQDFLKHPNLGWLITVGLNPLVAFASVIVANVAKVKLRQAASVDEAVQTLERLDSSLTNAEN